MPTMFYFYPTFILRNLSSDIRNFNFIYTFMPAGPSAEAMSGETLKRLVFYLADFRNFNFHLHVHAGRAFCGSYVRRNVKKT